MLQRIHQNYKAGGHIVLHGSVMIVVIGPRGGLDYPEFYGSIWVLKNDEISLMGIEVFVEHVLKVFEGKNVVSLLKIEDFVIVGVVVIIKWHFR